MRLWAWLCVRPAVALGGAAVAAAALALPGSPRIDSIPTAVGAGAVAALAVAAALAIPAPATGPSRHLRRAVPAVGFAAAGVVAGWAWWAAIADRSAGFPSLRAPTLAAAATVAGLGFGAVFRERRPAASGGYWPLLGLAAAVVVATAVVPVVRPAWQTDQRPGAGATRPVERPSTVAWQRRFPNLIDAVAIADNGVAVVREPGVVEAVDATTGRTRWTYSRRDAAVVTATNAVRVSPDGRTLAVPFGLGPDGGDQDVVVVLDGRTGAERWHRADGRPLVGTTGNTVVFRDVATSPRRPARRMFGVDTHSGRQRWQWTVPADDGRQCHLVDGQAGVALGDRLAVATVCSTDANRRGSVRLLADRDAREIARFDEDLGGPPPAPGGIDYVSGGLSVQATPAGLLAIETIRHQGGRNLRLVDGGAARELASMDPGRYVLRSVGDEGLLWWDNTRLVDGTGVRVNAISDRLGQRKVTLDGVPNGACVDLRPVWTRTHLVTLCSGPERAVRVVVSRLDGTADGSFELPAPVGELGRTVREWQQGVQFVSRGAGFPAGAAGAAVVLDRVHGTLLGLG